MVSFPAFRNRDKEQEQQRNSASLLSKACEGDVVVTACKVVRYFVVTEVEGLVRSGFVVDANGTATPFRLSIDDAVLPFENEAELVSADDASQLLEDLGHPELIFLQDRSEKSTTRRAQLTDLIKKYSPLLPMKSSAGSLLSDIKNRFGEKWIHKNGIIVPEMPAAQKKPKLYLPARIIRRVRVSLKIGLHNWKKRRKNKG